MRPVVMADKRTREVIRRFESAADAGMILGINGKSLARMCRHKTLQNDEHYFRYEEDFDQDEDFTGRDNCPVIVLDTFTGAVEWFPSRKAAASSLGFVSNAVCAAIAKKIRLGGQYRVVDAGRRVK